MKVDNLMKVLLSCNRNSASKVTKHNKAKLNRSSNCKVSNKENFKDLFKWIETKANKVDNLYFKKPKARVKVKAKVKAKIKVKARA